MTVWLTVLLSVAFKELDSDAVGGSNERDFENEISALFVEFSVGVGGGVTVNDAVSC